MGVSIHANLRFSDTVDVWSVSLDITANERTRFCHLLSEDETERPSRQVRTEKGRQRIVSVARRTAIPSRYAETTLWGQGRAILVDERETPPSTESVLQFSVSHSGDWMLLAVGCDCRVGIDVERLRQGVRVDNLVRRFFSDREIEQLLALPSENREAAFFRTWVRKEAYLKAVGGGVPAGLRRFSVPVGPGEPPAILWTELEDRGISALSLYDIDVPEGYVGALAVEGTGHRIRYLSWSRHSQSAV